MSVQPYLGINVNLASADELRQRGILDEDEPLLALFDGMLLDENRRRIGGVALCDFIALTDRRLITWARGFFNDTVDSFAWADVDVAKAETWDPWHGRVVFAFRLPAVAPRTRRIVMKGVAETPEGERVVMNTLDYMPADDVNPLANMIAWTGDQVMAGLSDETLVAAFAEQFPAPERQALSPFFAPMPPEPPPPPVAPVEQPRRRWWQRDAGESEPASTSGNLVADYESRRSAQPAGDGTPALPMAGPLPTMSEQPSMYEVSRSLRLLLEAPRRLAHGVRRAGEMMSGAGDLVNGLQDPQVRRNAMRGLYAAAAQQEAENGPLAPVGPVVRAAVRFSEPLPDEEAEAQAQARRIQVRAATRRSTPVQPEMPTPPAAEPPSATPPAAGPVRRSISVRRVEPQADVEAPAPATSRAPVRRISLSRDGEETAPAQRAVPAGVEDGE